MSAWLVLMLFSEDIPAREPPAYEIIRAAPPDRTVTRNGVQWSEWMSRAVPTLKCGSSKESCVADRLSIRNESGQMLRCHGKISYPQPNVVGIKDVEGTRLVRARRLATVVGVESPPNVTVASYEMDCTAVPPLPPLPPLNNPSECKMNMVRPVDPDAYFPPDAKAAWHAGPVILEFTLSATPSAPTKIEVVQSSTYTELDDAGRRVIGDMLMVTNCDGRRFRTMVDFTL